MKIKKLLSLIAAAAMTVTATIGAMTASAFNEADWYASDNVLYGYYGSDTDFELPTEMYGNKLDKVGEYFGSGYVWNSVIIPEGYIDVGECSFSDMDSLQSILLPNSLETIGRMAFSGCTNPNLVIDIHSTSLTSVDESSFDKIVGTIKVYSQEMYDLIAPLATTANVVLSANKLDYSKLREAVSNAGNYQEVAYTADSYKSLTDAVTAGNAVLTNEDATQTDIDNAATAINEAIAGLKFAGYSVLETLIGQADDIVNNHADEYVSLINLNSVLSGAKPVLETAKSSEMTEELQAQVNDYAQRVKEQIDALEKVDIPAELKKLQTVIENAEALSASEYTEDSYKVLTDAINEAKKITESSPYSEIISAKTAVTNAVNKLVSKPLDPIGYIRHGWTDKAFVSGTTSEEMAGATQIKLTFDCASDTSYNQYFTTPIEAKIGSTVSNFEMKGTAAAENLGEKNCTATMTLTAPVEAGQNYTLTGYTYGYANAKDYVFAMTKVEFLDESGKVLGKVTAKTIAQNKLAEAITKAEEIKADDYTAESVAELTKAIESAKALTDEATAEEINKAITAMEDTVKALVYKPADYTKVDEAIAKIPSDLSKYTDETVKALKDAVAAVDRNKNITEQETVDDYAKAINDAVSALKVKPDTTKQDPSKPSVNTPTKPSTKTTRSKEDVKKDKSAAKKAMKQAKISKLKVKSKSKKKINVTWKKVKKAKGYQVQVSAKKNFKKVIFKKDLKKTKLNIKNKKIKSKKTYYVRVRAYATYKNTNNKTVKVYSKWNKKLRKVKVK